MVSDFKFFRYILKKKIIPFLLIISILTLSIIGCTNNSTFTIAEEGKMVVHYIDVNQGDSILIQVNNMNLLIDSGPPSSKNMLLNYLDDLNIEKLDYLIATHPHDDHIGNLDDVIRKYEIGSFYAPKVTHNTKSYENMINSLKEKNLKIKVIKEGITSINLGEGTRVSIFSPIEEEYSKGSSSNLNNYSPIMKIEYFENAFLFTGDAEKEAEEVVLSQKHNISADVIKFGHHGSSTSSSEAFIKRVNPSIGIIQLGKDNSFGHPHKETLSLIEKFNIKTYRNDLNGNIVLVSDGKTIYKK